MKEQLLANLAPLLTALIIALVTFVVGFSFSKLMARFIRKSSEHLSTDPTHYSFLRHFLTALIYIVGLSLAIWTIPYFRGVASSLLAGAGILAVAVGFASQQALSNIVAGIFMVIFKPFRVNDRVTIKDTLSGIVEDITLRHTVIRDFQNRRIIIPNSVISNEVIVNSDLVESKLCRWIEIGISYDSDIAKAKGIIREEVLAHPNFIDNRTEEQIAAEDHPVIVRVLSLGESSVNLRAYAWAKDQASGFEMACDLHESIKQRFDREGIEIPFPHRTLVYKGQLKPFEISMKDNPLA